MMTCNEEDCIAEVMQEHAKYFDKILVLDGSSDNTPEIIRSFKNVVYFAKDQDVLPGIKIRDGARQVLLAEAQKRFGYDGWFTLLHGDEIFHDSPNTTLIAAEKAKVDKVHWYAMQFFLHTSDQTKKFAEHESLQNRVRWYCPGFMEIRQFRNKKGIFYPLDQHGCLFPKGLNARINSKFPVYKHYAYRSLEQVTKKILQTQKTQFGGAYHQDLQKLIFIEKLAGYKQARHFDGSFKEFELKQQSPLWLRYFSFWKYR
jgi:glycosyltransferase involved in cell wall biosynthesis